MEIEKNIVSVPVNDEELNAVSGGSAYQTEGICSSCRGRTVLDGHKMVCENCGRVTPIKPHMRI